MDKLDPKQFGLPKKSTTQALVYLMHQIHSALDKGHCSARVFFAEGNGKSSWKKINGGLPQGTKLGPLLFAIMVNSLLKDWQGRIKYVDDTSALEIIPRCSPSLLPLVVDKIFDFAVSRGMKLNPSLNMIYSQFILYIFLELW